VKFMMLFLLLLHLSLSVFGLSSYTDTAIFTVDTIGPTVNLLSPNGGEDCYTGIIDSIKWEATDDNLSATPITLSYILTSEGSLYTIVENALNSGDYPWTVPTQQTNTAKIIIKVKDTFGNIAQMSSAQNFHIHYTPPAKPESLDVYINNNNDAVLNWAPVTQSVFHTHIDPDGYIILCCETAKEDEHYYYFLGRSYYPSYTHQDVAEFREKMFYKVKAYKNYSNNVNVALDNLCNRAVHERIFWKDAIKILQQEVLE
jgi:hypothetical protein